jgi:hypothetical protein
MNSLRSALTAASPATNGPDIRAKENIRYELTQTQKPLDIDRPSHGRPMRSLTGFRLVCRQFGNNPLVCVVG